MEMSNSLESVQALDLDNVSDESDPEKMIECADETTMLPEKSENGKQRKLVPGSCVFDLVEVDVSNRLGFRLSVNEPVSETVIQCDDPLDVECAVNMDVQCIPYPPIGDEVILDEDYECEEPNIVKMAQTLVISKWPEMHSVFSK
jgi:hypothetical protein